jgi:hypothetical protein
MRSLDGPRPFLRRLHLGIDEGEGQTEMVRGLRHGAFRDGAAPNGCSLRGADIATHGAVVETPAI